MSDSGLQGNGEQIKIERGRMLHCAWRVGAPSTEHRRVPSATVNCESKIWILSELSKEVVPLDTHTPARK